MSYYYSSQSGLYLQNSSASNLVNLITKGFNVDFLPLTLDKINNRVGINNTTPEFALHVNGGIKANSLDFAPDCYLRKSENDDMIINIPQEKTFAVYENGLNLLDVNSNMTNIYTKANFYNHVGVMTQPDSNFVLSVNGKLNISHFFDNITFNSSANTIGVTANNDMTIKIPSNKKLSISYSGSENILEVDATTNSIGINKTPTDNFKLDVNGDIRGNGRLTVANDITVDKVFTNLLEANGNIVSSALIKGNQVETNFIYSQQGGLINGELLVQDFTAKNYLASEKTGSVFAYSLNFNQINFIDIVRGDIRGIPGEPGSGLEQINMFDCVEPQVSQVGEPALPQSPYVASYGRIATDLAYGTELINRSGVVESSPRAYKFPPDPVQEKMNITKVRFVFRLLHLNVSTNPQDHISIGSGFNLDGSYESYLVIFLKINNSYYSDKNEHDDKRTIFSVRSYPDRGFSTCLSPWILYENIFSNPGDLRSYVFGVPYGSTIRLGEIQMQFK
jgi:hypothetical protein